MKHSMFSVYDQKADAFLPPFVMHNDALAVRVFADCCNAKDHQFGKHPEDYALYNLGVFDDSDGSLDPVHKLKLVVHGKACVRPEHVVLEDLSDA